MQFVILFLEIKFPIFPIKIPNIQSDIPKKIMKNKTC